MKKIFKFCAVGLLALCCQSLSNTVLVETQNRNDLVASTEDVFNEKQNVAKFNIKRASSSSNLNCSKIYTQYGYDGTNYYLRFATAVKGDLDSITYSADILNSDHEIADKRVDSVYKSIAANGKSYYFTGNSLINEALSSTEDYYWACYTIKFNEDSEFMASDIKVDINVNDGAYTNTRTTSLDALLNGDQGGEEEQGEKMTLGEYALDCNSKGTTPKFNYEKVQQGYVEKSGGKNCEITQGGCTDGTYLYFVLNTNGNEGNTKNSAGHVVKYDVASKTVLDQTSLIVTESNNNDGLGNGNLFYNPIDGMIYSLGCVRTNGGQCPDYRINPSDMSYEKLGDIRTVNGFEFELPSVDGVATYDVYNIEYNASSQRWAVIYRLLDSAGANIATNPYRMYFYDSSLKFCTDATQGIDVRTSLKATNHTIQEMSSDSKYIYVDYTKYAASPLKSYIRVFDWNGTEKIEVVLDPSKNTFSNSDGAANIQFVENIKGDLYVGAYQSSTGIHLTKVSHDGTTSTTPSTPSTSEDTVKLNFGESMEYASITGQSTPLSSVAIIEEEKVEGILPIYNGTEEGLTLTGYAKSYYWVSKGATTDGEYIYQVLYADADGNKGCDTGIIAKYTVDGEFVKSTKYSFHWGNNVRLGFADGKIYAGRTTGCQKASANWGCGNATTYNKDALVFDTDLNLLDDHYESEFGTPVLDGVNGYIDMVSGSKDGRRFAYVYCWSVNGSNLRKLYTYEKNADGTFKTLVNGLELPSAKASNNKTGAVTGIYGNDSYLYLLYNIATCPVIRVLDWNGNEIAVKEISSLSETNDGNKGYTGILEIDGKLYYSVYSWNNWTSGLNYGWSIYHIDYSVNTNSNLKRVSFNTNGAQKLNNMYIEVGGTVPRPLDPTYSYTDKNGKTYNYVLENWYNGEKIWDFENDVVTGDIVLTAKWTFEDEFFAVKEDAHVRAEGTTARIMSFNILCDDYNNRPAVDDTRANQAFDTIERYAPDVVGLQEFDDEWYAKSKTLLDGYKVVNIDNNKINGVTNYTTLAYNTSTVKLISYEQKALATNNNANCRNVTMGLFEFISGDNVGKQFIVTSTHWELSENLRVKNAEETAKLLKEWEDEYPNVPIIATGDYNAYDDQQAAPTFLSETGYLDTKNAENTGIVCKTTHIGNGMLVGDKDTKNPEHWLRGPVSFLPAHIEQTTCIDHIYTTTDVTALYYDTVVDSVALSASDHCPIYCDLQF